MQAPSSLTSLESPSSATVAGSHIQRKCSACTAEEENEEHLTVSRFPDERIQAQSVDRIDAKSARELSPGLERSIGSLEGNGVPLPRQSRAFFENRMGWDFGNVRIHTDAQAARTARFLGARAFTARENIAFAPGEFKPGTPDGDRLLAHELTHVIQQSKGSTPRVQRDLFDDAANAIGSIADSAESAYNKVSQAANDFAGSAWDAAMDLGGEVKDTARDLALRAVQALAAQFGGSLTVTEDGLILLVIPNVTLMQRHATGAAWNNATDDVLIGQFPIELGEELGSIFLSVLARGELDVAGEIGAGPVQLTNITLAYDTNTEDFSGAATLSAQADLAAFLTTTGVLAGTADWNCESEIVRAEGGLSITGAPSLSTMLSMNVKLGYRDGEFYLQESAAVTPCVNFTLSLDSFLKLMILNHTVASGSWYLTDRTWENCWPIDIWVGKHPASQGGSSGGGGSTDSWGPDDGDFASQVIGISPVSLNDIFSTPDVLQSMFSAATPEFTKLGPLNVDDANKVNQVCKPMKKEGGKRKAPTGDRNDPIKMIWFKPLSKYRNPIFLSFDPYDLSEKKEPYYRNLRKRLPRSTKFIGVNLWPGVGTKLQRMKTPRDPSVTKSFTEDLNEFGFDMFERGYQADHVVDLAFGGADSYANLWPLDAQTNEWAGALHSFLQPVKFNFPDDSPDQEPRVEKISPPHNPQFFNGRWFVISEVRNP